MESGRNRQYYSRLFRTTKSYCKSYRLVTQKWSQTVTGNTKDKLVKRTKLHCKSYRSVTQTWSQAVTGSNTAGSSRRPNHTARVTEIPFESKENMTLECCPDYSLQNGTYQGRTAGIQGPITDISDDRLKDNRDAMDWFVHWENSVKNNATIKNKEKCLISHQTRQDIISAVLGFEELCLYKLKKSNASIIPNRINSEVIENIFCQQRTLHNGANSNPTYLGYCHSINSVILGQASVSKKSNTGGVEDIQKQYCPSKKVCCYTG
ncbi:unnamed protein product [Mytilus coruscus]|uniref:Uncharacterized protein n=1 Tax=Mytilus coruscus TaxID=42192 RepID=A0A6J8CKG3_MYTCO|nr:unnamed protein product [Mytilus coruscus]